MKKYILAILSLTILSASQAFAQKPDSYDENYRATAEKSHVDRDPTDFRLVVTKLDVNGDQYTISGTISYTKDGKKQCVFTDVQLEYQRGTANVCDDEPYRAILQISGNDIGTKIYATIKKNVDWLPDPIVAHVNTTIGKARADAKNSSKTILPIEGPHN